MLIKRPSDLTCLAQKSAIDFIKKNLTTNNRNDLKTLESCAKNNVVELRGFARETINLRNFDWNEFGKDRSWWWQIQALPFLTWFISSYDLQTPEERETYYSYCLDCLNNWQTNSMSNKASPLAWHDHAAAFRVRNIVNWAIFTSHAGLIPSDESARKNILNLIEKHLKWLAESSNYSKHTNHGFDQSLIMYTIAMYFGENYPKYIELGQRRLIDELDFAFTEQGVHKENSPGYQKFMLSRLNNLLSLSDLGDKKISTRAEEFTDKATAFLKAITMPNDLLPMIGDTRWDDRSESEVLSEHLIIHDYSASGYLIAKGKDSTSKDFYLVFKNCHDSNYHRHDDDLSIIFYYDGKLVFGDGGLLSHNEKDEKRIFVRSPLAHCLPILPFKAERDRSKLVSTPTLRIDESGRFYGTSHMFGKKVERSIDISNIRSGQIVITDSSSTGVPINSNFLIPEKSSMRFKNSSVTLSFDSFEVRLDTGEKHLEASTCLGWNAHAPEFSAIISKHLGITEDVSRLWISTGEENIITVNFR